MPGTEPAQECDVHSATDTMVGDSMHFERPGGPTVPRGRRPRLRRRPWVDHRQRVAGVTQTIPAPAPRLSRAPPLRRAAPDRRPAGDDAGRVAAHGQRPATKPATGVRVAPAGPPARPPARPERRPDARPVTRPRPSWQPRDCHAHTTWSDGDLPVQADDRGRARARRPPVDLRSCDAWTPRTGSRRLDLVRAYLDALEALGRPRPGDRRRVLLARPPLARAAARRRPPIHSPDRIAARDRAAPMGRCSTCSTATCRRV